MDSTAQTNERAVEGVTTGLIGLGQTVTWEATHFLIKQRLTAKIVAFDRPNHFRDSMIHGAFKHFDHDHYFEEVDGLTRMTDIFEYSSPLGLLGRIANWMFVDSHMRRLLSNRNAVIKEVAESGSATKYLQAASSAD